MEGLDELLPWFLGSTVVGALGGSFVGAHFFGPVGAVAGVVAGPVVVMITTGTIWSAWGDLQKRAANRQYYRELEERRDPDA